MKNRTHHQQNNAYSDQRLLDFYPQISLPAFSSITSPLMTERIKQGTALLGLVGCVSLFPAAVEAKSPLPTGDLKPAEIALSVDPAVLEHCNDLTNDRFVAAAQIGDLQAVRRWGVCGHDPDALGTWREIFADGDISVLMATPLHVAIWREHEDVVNQLLTWGADVNAVDEWGLSILITAAEVGRMDFVMDLIEAGADVNFVASCEDCIDETALTIAADRGYVSVVEVLLQAGADPDYRDRFGQSALDLATENGHTEVVELLTSID